MEGGLKLGRHLIADLSGCDPLLLDDVSFLEKLAVRAVEEGGGTVLATRSHKFAPQGATVVVLVAESHLALHTWPEHGFIGFDYFTCGVRLDPRVALRVITEALAPTDVATSELERGTSFPVPRPPD